MLLVGGVRIGTQPAWAWGGDGHCIVARIAELRLTDKAQHAVKKLLYAHESLADDDIANWADLVRNDRPQTKGWHFVDIPVEGSGYDKGRDCQGDNCVVARVEGFAKSVADPNLSDADRREALLFLVHFVGDMHQPLHCAERKGADGTPDRGGNLRKVLVPKGTRTTNLHSVWDTYLVQWRLQHEDPLDFGEAINHSITTATATKWETGTVTKWAEESHALAVTEAYKGIPAGGPAPRLKKGYIQTNSEIVETQLARAGVRLAFLLNQAFK